MKKIIVIFGLLVGFLSAQKSDLKNVKVLPYKTKRELVKYMKSVVAPELGVKCN